MKNPFYNPNWAADCRARDEECARWEAVCARFAQGDGFGSAQHLRVLEAYRQAKGQSRLARLGRFETIGDYAAWRFEALPPSRAGAELVQDFGAFGSIEEVEAAFERADRRRAEVAMLDEVLLPVRQPVGLVAFAEPGAVISSWRRLGALECLVSFCQTGEVLHFCLAHRWGGFAAKSNEMFRGMASLLGREAILFAMPEARVVFEGGGHRLMAHREVIRGVNAMAGRMRFYRHLWPDKRLKEEFSRVDMGWDGVCFVDPDWSGELFGALPVALREASGAFPQGPLLLR